GAKKDEEDFEPAVPNDVAEWLPSSDCTSTRRTELRGDVEGDALEAQGVAALGARRKMFKTFKVVRKKM
ncbi:hypothetical protein EDB84DRAFT_1257266, partial [Lactarius hengduanensis]